MSELIYCENFRLVMSLMVSNLLAAAGVGPLRLTQLFACSSHIYAIMCSLLLPMRTLVATSGTLSVLVVSVDCYCAVTVPLHYSMTMTKRRCNLMITLLWISSVVISFSPIGCFPYEVFESDICLTHIESECFQYYTVCLFVVGFALPFAFLCCLYTKMYIAAHGNSARHRNREVYITKNGEPLDSDEESGGKSACLVYIHSMSFFREEGKAMKTSFLVIFSFIFCWFPFYYDILNRAILMSNIALSENQATILLMFGPLILPFLFVYRRKNSYDEIKKMLKIIFSQTQTLALVTATRSTNINHSGYTPPNTPVFSSAEFCRSISTTQIGHVQEFLSPNTYTSKLSPRIGPVNGSPRKLSIAPSRSKEKINSLPNSQTEDEPSEIKTVRKQRTSVSFKFDDFDTPKREKPRRRHSSIHSAKEFLRLEPVGRHVILSEESIKTESSFISKTSSSDLSDISKSPAINRRFQLIKGSKLFEELKIVRTSSSSADTNVLESDLEYDADIKYVDED